MPPLVRRTQAERRETTQRAILEGAARALEEVGYNNFTTAFACEKAGVSQGALFRYFPTKNALVVAAAGHIFAELRNSFGTQLFKGKGRPTEAKAIAALWDVFCSPTLRVIYELYCAAATEPELAEGLKPIVDEHTEATRAAATLLFPAHAEEKNFHALIDMVLFSMQGASLQFCARREPTRGRALLEFLVGAVEAKPE